jgi:hypothetical protein
MSVLFSDKSIKENIHTRRQTEKNYKMLYLSEVEGEGDPLEAHAVLQRGTLPPAVGAVDGQLGRVSAGGLAGLGVAHAALRLPLGAVLHQFAVALRTLLAAGGVARNEGATRQVQHRREQTLILPELPLLLLDERRVHALSLTLLTTTPTTCSIKYKYEEI